MRSFRRLYGSSPLHLLSLVACFALAGYAALQVLHASAPVRTGVWFFGALIAHDLVLFPLYALADRSAIRLTRRSRSAEVASGTANYLRVPALASGLLLLVFFPLIVRQGATTYRDATGLDSTPYLTRWLLLTGVAFAVSALLYAINLGRGRDQQAPAGRPEGLSGSPTSRTADGDHAP